MRRILITGGSGFIGTNYVESLRTSSNEIRIQNIDIKKPRIDSHQQFWNECDIFDSDKVALQISRFQPTEIIHLAARTDTESNNLDDYYVNTQGTANVLNAAKSCSSLDSIIITSTQFVKRPGTQPKHDEDFDPHTAYGESKVISEQMTRNANLQCSWTIIRPTNIWGPWHPRYPYEFWRILAKGLYFHPSGQSAIRSYGYVENVIYQIERILKSERTVVDHRVYYVGDEPIALLEWVDGFALALTGKKVKVLPRWFIKSLSILGDTLTLLGIRFPITTSRYKSMTTDDLVPIGKTIAEFGGTPISLEKGIRETALWLKQQKIVENIYQ